jgi:hypothetical protein
VSSYIVRVIDPCTVGRIRFKRERQFQTLREAERYARRAKELRLDPAIELAPALVKRFARRFS